LDKTVAKIKTPSRPSFEERFEGKFPKFSIIRSTPTCPVLCRVDDSLRASFEGLAARVGAAVRRPASFASSALSRIVSAPPVPLNPSQIPSWRRRNSRGRSEGILTTPGEQGVIGDELVAVGFDYGRDIFVSVENCSFF
jgi:hypothetical protein